MVDPPQCLEVAYSRLEDFSTDAVHGADQPDSQDSQLGGHLTKY